MKFLLWLSGLLISFVPAAWATVVVTTPSTGNTVATSVQYHATSSSSTCKAGVASMGVYVDNVLVAVQQGAAFTGNITLNPGQRHTVVEEWDHCGGATYTSVNVLAVAPAATVSLGASPNSVTYGGSVTLTASTTNATRIQISGSDSSNYSMPAGGGTLVVHPTQNVIYTATATGPGASASSSTSVTVKPLPPIVNMGANPATIVSGKSSMITVSAVNATQLRLSGSDGSTYTLAATGGSIQVQPGSTTTYTAAAIGSGGSVSANAVLTVTPAAPFVNVVASPSTITTGNSSVLQVAATGSQSVTVAGSDGSNYTLAWNGGSLTVNPAQTTTYTVTATGAGGMTAAVSTITVKAAAPTVLMTASPSTIVAGKSSLLSVTATNSTSVTVTGTDGSTYTLARTGGTLSVSPNETTTYAVAATGPGGVAAANSNLTVTEAPPTVTATASPATISTGGSSVLTIAATSASQVNVTGSDGSNYSLTNNGGTISVTPKQTTSYTATAINASGEVTASATVTFNTHSIPADATSSGFLEGSAKWLWNHDPGTPGTSVGSSQYPITSPSMDNYAREYSYSYFNHGGEIYHLSFAHDSQATHFVYDVNVYLTDPSQTENIEMDMNQVIPDGQTVILGTQCAGGSGTWEYTTTNSGGTQWSKSNIPCNPTTWSAKTWHHIQIATHRDASGVVTYDWVNFDGTYSDFQNASGLSALSLNWSAGDLLLNFQLDGAKAGSGSASVFTDQLQIYRW